MGSLPVSGADIAYRISGSGPPLLAPECNYAWDPEFEALMAHSFTVIAASPRDFHTSTRPGAPYAPASWASDLVAVAHHLGYERFLVFGYSFTGAFGPWLALQPAGRDAVAAVASGGFPLLGDYSITSRDVEAQLRQLEQDHELWDRYSEKFDLRAGAAFYRELATLPQDALVDGTSCPLYSFWGERDLDAVGMVLPHSELAEGLDRRGVTWRQHPGYDHEGLNSDLGVAWPEVETWLLEQAGRVGL